MSNYARKGPVVLVPGAVLREAGGPFDADKQDSVVGGFGSKSGSR